MCNLYAMTRSADEMRRVFADLDPVDLLGRLAAHPKVRTFSAASVWHNYRIEPFTRANRSAKVGLPISPSIKITGKSVAPPRVTDTGCKGVRPTFR
jgi:hypothetical protein